MKRIASIAFASCISCAMLWPMFPRQHQMVATAIRTVFAQNTQACGLEDLAPLRRPAPSLISQAGGPDGRRGSRRHRLHGLSQNTHLSVIRVATRAIRLSWLTRSNQFLSSIKEVRSIRSERPQRSHGERGDAETEPDTKLRRNAGTARAGEADRHMADNIAITPKSIMSHVFSVQLSAFEALGESGQQMIRVIGAESQRRPDLQNVAVPAGRTDQDSSTTQVVHQA